MKIATDISDMFGEDVRHLHGNLFRVRRERIRMARAGVSVENGSLVYGNPRWFINKDGDPEARGIESSKMEELKTSIQNSGLDNPIRLRPVDSDGAFLEIVNGERRFRCIESLCKDGVVCHDATVGDKAPAEEVYEWVDCRIEEMDDCEALSVALKTNETSEVIGDLASIEVVKALRSAEYDDAEILRSTGKSVSWLRETDRIIGLDAVCLDHFQKEQITRKAALQLALIENAEERISLLEQIVNIARDRHQAKIRSLDKQIEDAETNEMISGAAAEVAKKIGDDEQAKKLSEAESRARNKSERARGEREKATAKPPKADARDIKRVRPSRGKKDTEESVSGVESPMGAYVQMIEQIIAAEGFDDNGDSLGINLEMLTAVLGVLMAISQGEDDAMSVLAANCPLVIEDEETDEVEEDSSYDDEDEEDDDSSEDDEEAEDQASDGLYESSEDEEDEIPAELESEFREASFYDEDDED